MSRLQHLSRRSIVTLTLPIVLCGSGAQKCGAGTSDGLLNHPAISSAYDPSPMDEPMQSQCGHERLTEDGGERVACSAID
jgi:hypothetical protein